MDFRLNKYSETIEDQGCAVVGSSVSPVPWRWWWWWWCHGGGGGGGGDNSRDNTSVLQQRCQRRAFQKLREDVEISLGVMELVQDKGDVQKKTGGT